MKLLDWSTSAYVRQSRATLALLSHPPVTGFPVPEGPENFPLHFPSRFALSRDFLRTFPTYLLVSKRLCTCQREGKREQNHPRRGDRNISTMASKQAEQLRLDGNFYFKKDRFAAAIDAYTEVNTSLRIWLVSESPDFLYRDEMKLMGLGFSVTLS